MSSAPTASAWWQLLRVGNVFTAVSNVLAGYLLACGEWQPILPLIFLILSSASLYLAGMVLNDVFDLEVDRVERPERPLPSEQIDKSLAMAVGWGLVVDGVSAAALVAWLIESWLPLIVAILLTLAIIAYNALLKNTKLGPLSMGLCRALNVLLGASAARNFAFNKASLYYAGAIGIYTIGLTLLARNEVQQNQRRNVLLASAVTQLGCIFVFTAFPSNDDEMVRFLQLFLLIIVCLLPIRHYLHDAINRLTPQAVQTSVSRLIAMFIVLDATVCWATAGWFTGVLILSLLIPTYVATRRIAMT